MSQPSRLEIAQRYFDALGGPDGDAFVGLFTPDAVVDDPVGTPTQVGSEAIAKFHRGVKRAWSSLRMTPREAFERGDRLAVWWTADGLSVNGSEVAFAGIDIFTIGEDGLIQRLEGYWDLEGVLAKL